VGLASKHPIYFGESLAAMNIRNKELFNASFLRSPRSFKGESVICVSPCRFKEIAL
jgi:hypothetical protein